MYDPDSLLDDEPLHAGGQGRSGSDLDVDGGLLAGFAWALLLLAGCALIGSVAWGLLG
jgi:hypothetical protein